MSKRCKYGKLKNPSGARRCRMRPHGRRGKRPGKRGHRRHKRLLSGVGLGVGVLLIGAAIIVPNLVK